MACINIIPISGCTNPLASNYDPFATQNDGSCVFQSGCTKTYADNYDASAVIDDGSCYCAESNLLFVVDGSSAVTFTVADNETCNYVFSFDMLLEVSCIDVLNFYSVHTDRTMIELLNGITGGLVVRESSGGTSLMDKGFYVNDVLDSKIQFNGDECDILYCLIEKESGINCVTLTDDNPRWQTFNILLDSSVIGKTASIFLNLNGLPFDHTLYIDNISLDKICNQTRVECNLIPQSYGFDMAKQVDNIKSGTSAINTLNSKELTLRVNPYNYIQQDVADFFNHKKQFLKNDAFRQLTVEKMATQMDVAKLNCIYEYYLKECSSKKLGYGYAREINDKLNDVWFEIIKKTVPSSSIWDNGKYLYKNMIFHQQQNSYPVENCILYDELLIEDTCDETCLTRSDDCGLSGCGIGSLISNEGDCLLDNEGKPIMQNG